MTATVSALILKISLIALLALLPASPGMGAPADRSALVIAHRGASGDRPEHTLAAYERAIDQGADYIEIDLVVTADNALVARHENELSDTTDVAEREEFAGRRRAKTIDGRLINGWFAEDFTLAEVRSLRAKERIPGLRQGSARFDGLYQVPTFEEVLDLVLAKQAESGRKVGIYPELKHPTFLLQQGFDTVDLLVTALRKAGLDAADDPVFIQSFEVVPLQRLNRMIEVPLVQLVAVDGGPADEPGMRYAAMIRPAGLADIARYADALGADARLVIAPDGLSTGLVAAAKAAGLEVHTWTLRKENAFLPPALRRGSAEAAVGDIGAAAAMLRKEGVAGVITDDPGLVVRTLTPAG